MINSCTSALYGWFDITFYLCFLTLFSCEGCQVVSQDPGYQEEVMSGHGWGLPLKSTEAFIFWHNLLAQVMCCLPESHIQDIMERLSRLSWPSDHYSMLTTDDTSRGDLKQIKSDYMALGTRMKGMEAQVVLLSILPIYEQAPARSRYILEISKRLCRWYHQQRFAFFNYRVVFQENRLLGRAMGYT